MKLLLVDYKELFQCFPYVSLSLAFLVLSAKDAPLTTHTNMNPCEQILCYQSFWYFCQTAANIISLLDRPVITWVPLLVDLDLEGQIKLEGQGREDSKVSSVAVSSFGRFDTMAQSVITTLTHFNWLHVGKCCE